MAAATGSSRVLNISLSIQRANFLSQIRVTTESRYGPRWRPRRYIHRRLVRAALVMGSFLILWPRHWTPTGIYGSPMAITAGSRSSPAQGRGSRPTAKPDLGTENTTSL